MCLGDEMLLIVGLLSSAANRFVFAYADIDWQIYVGLSTFKTFVIVGVKTLLDLHVSSVFPFHLFTTVKRSLLVHIV